MGLGALTFCRSRDLVCTRVLALESRCAPVASVATTGSGMHERREMFFDGGGVVTEPASRAITLPNLHPLESRRGHHFGDVFEGWVND